jgi:ATP-dependent exoDNAse (exonuclease V) beta subunit
VMTVHKAKGLDFRHTYLVQAHRRSREESARLVDAEEIGDRFEYVLFGAPTPGWAGVAERRRRVAGAEMVRTLYVAMTRARDRLVIAGSWPDGAATAPASHLDLLASRHPEGGLARLAAEVAAGGGRHADRDGVRWVFPTLTAAEPAPPPNLRSRAVALPGEVAHQARLLVELRADAAARMGRPFAAPASAEAHRLLRQLVVEVGEEGDWAAAERRPETGVSVATAAGSVVHRVLEGLNLGEDLAAGLQRARERVPEELWAIVGSGALAGAVERSRAILDRLAGGSTLERLAAVAPYVVARELPVLLPPDGDPDGAVGFVSGTIDLVYWDPGSGELVIADYKTDEVATDEEIADRISAYAPQGVVYRRALREALGLARDPRFELWFLHADRIETV